MDLKVISGKNVLFLVVPKNNFIFHLPKVTRERIPARERALLPQQKQSVSFKK